MNKWWRNSVLLGFILACSIALAGETTVPASSLVTAEATPFSDPSHAITATADNPEFSISMQSNPTTGYRWYLKPWAIAWLIIVDQEYDIQDTTAVGAGGTETWHFKLLPQAFNARFILPIEFVSIRPWTVSSDKSMTTQTFYVVTEPKDS
jgi:hypothetical protein